ncbi:MAG: sprB, partial [Bacteroidetes bacterium]|nr:sprB [Bacteroidota bacterium]
TTPYTVTYTLGICAAQATGTVTINMPPTLNVTTVNSICTANNGKARVAVVGNAPYTYAWSAPGGNNDTITNLAPGNYDVSVTDNNGCSSTASGTVGLSSPTIPISLVSEHDLKCNNDNTGSITISAGGSGTLAYNWSPVGTGNRGTVSGLAAGTYNVTVTDQYGCTGTAQYTVNEPTALTLAPLTYTDPICPGGSDGTASGIPSGGSGAYHYAWDSNPAQNTQQATGLPEGTYTLEVTDDSSCVVSESVILMDPAATTFGPGSVTDTRCFGSSDGTAQVSPQGAFGPYQYLWTPGNQSGALARGLAAGTYHVVVTDVRGCTVSTDVMIGQPFAVVAAISETDLTCYQNNSGTATISAIGGTVPYSFHWSNGDSTAQIQGLQSATYLVTVTDGLGCTADTSIFVDQPSEVTLIRTAVSTTCAATVDGSITVVGSGGAGVPFTYYLKDVVGSTIQTNNTGVFTGLGAQFYTVVVADQHGCSASDTVTVPRAPFNVYTAITDSTSCYGPEYRDGRLHLQGLTIFNGPFQYSVDNSPAQFIPDFYDLAAGVHNVIITDAHGCDTTFTVIVGEPMPASVDILPGDSTIAMGSSLQLTTAFRPYSTDSIKSYAWSPSEGLSCIDCPSPVASPFGSQNIYTVTVTYNQGCLAITTVRISVDGDPPVYVPNAFSPNGDGANDEFIVYGEGIKTIKMTIFNRWGEKVFESNDQSQGWDGSYKGVQQPPGVYIYIVDLVYLNEHKRLKDGSITLIR